jgi:hypothetical protein
MSINLSEFPQLKLAPDLAGELLFYDKVTTPAPKSVWRKMVAELVRNGGTNGISYEEYCDARRHQPKFSKFAVYAVEFDNKVFAVMCDYWNSIYFDYDGVFSEVLKRANVVTKVKKGLSQIVPDHNTIAVQGKKFPSHFVHYDNKSGVGTVVPWDLYEQAMDPGWDQKYT